MLCLAEGTPNFNGSPSNVSTGAPSRPKRAAHCPRLERCFATVWPGEKIANVIARGKAGQSGLSNAGVAC
jgi:hypothetical protein